MRYPSSVATYTRPFHKATPRLTASQQARRTQLPSTCGSYFHNSLPLRASSAYTTLQGPEKYMTPSATSGEASLPRWVRPRTTKSLNSHASPSVEAFDGPICSSGENRASSKVRP